MKTNHNKWMKILQAIFSLLANIFGNLKIKETDGRSQGA